MLLTSADLSRPARSMYGLHYLLSYFLIFIFLVVYLRLDQQKDDQVVGFFNHFTVINIDID